MAEKDIKPTPGQDPEADTPELNTPTLAPGDVAPVVDPSPRFYRDWRGAVEVASALNLVAGVWLIVSPFALDYAASDSRLIPIIAGVLIAFLALIRLGLWRAEWLSLINVAIGVVRESGTSEPLVSIAPSITNPVIISW